MARAKGGAVRHQRNAYRGSRPSGLGHPRATTHTAASYDAKYRRENQNLNRLFRLVRLRRKEARS